MESQRHQVLKSIAGAYLRSLGCPIVAHEVRCPISRYLVDVAAYWDRLPTRPRQGSPADLADTLWDSGPRGSARTARSIEPRTVVIECKQSRADFLKDKRHQDELLAQRERLSARREWMERERVRRFEPHLRRSGSALFPELEEWDYSASRLGDYRRLLRELRAIDRRIHGETKFCMIARYNLADRLYILAPAGMIKPRELPAGWGLLECPLALVQCADRHAGRPDPSRVRVRVPSRNALAPERFRHRLLRNIAAAATRRAQPPPTHARVAV